MKYVACRRLFVLSFVAAIFLSIFLAGAASAQRGRRFVRTRAPQTSQVRPEVRTPEREKVVAPKIGPEEAAKQLAELCATLKNDFKPLTDKDVRQSKQHLLTATDDLIRVIKTDPDRKSAAIWMERFALQKLRDALASDGDSLQEAMTETWRALHANHKGIRWSVFEDLRVALRQYFRLTAMIAPVAQSEGSTVEDEKDVVAKKTAYAAEFERICGTLPATIEAYAKNVIVREDAELANAMTWLEDVAAVEPRAAKLAVLARIAFSGVNVRVQVGADLIAAGFQTEIAEEKMEISENILGTRVTGSGTMSAKSTGSPVDAKDHAEILVEVDAKMNSDTTGRQSPVTVKTRTSGTLHGEKRIIIAEDRITTSPARTKADLQSNLYSVRVNGGPLVQSIARSEVQDRQGASKAESRRRAEARMNGRIDEMIDARIADLNAKYREKLREPLMQAGLFPRIWELSSTRQAMNWNALVASASQPSAMNPAPEADKDHSILVRIHQSALNNAAAIALAGKYFDEDEVVKQLQEQFGPLPEDQKPAALDRPDGEDPLRVTFATESPIRVSFNDNKITVLVQVHEFFLPRRGDDAIGEDGKPLLQARRGLNIELTYDVKIEKVEGKDGVMREVVVLEQTEEPQLSPRDGGRFSALSNPTQTVVKRRLKAMQTRIVGQPRELEGEWKGKGTLIPTFASAKDGWLTVAWDWVAAE